MTTRAPLVRAACVGVLAAALWPGPSGATASSSSRAPDPLRTAPAPLADCSRTSVGLTPLDNLGNSMWEGHTGGLYPDGAREPPPAHADVAGLRAAQIVPRAPDGTAAANGRIVLLSIGMSNATQEYRAFMDLAGRDTGLNPRLALVDGAQGSQTAAVIRDEGAAFWTNVDERLRQAGVTAQQVQAVWLKEANAGPRGDAVAHAQELSGHLGEIVAILARRYPNLQLVYLASRTYAGYASTALNPEPYAYASGFAVKWLIARQIDGAPELNADPRRGLVRAPALLWGAYLWADGETPRSDGLTWLCSDFGPDGTHPSDAGRRKVAELLLGFWKASPSSRPWFVGGAAPTLTPTVAPTASPGATMVTPPTPSPTALSSVRLFLPAVYADR